MSYVSDAWKGFASPNKYDRTEYVKYEPRIEEHWQTQMDKINTKCPNAQIEGVNKCGDRQKDINKWNAAAKDLNVSVDKLMKE